MPRRNDLRTILVLGSGPIVIGQACEFDYSGTQAVKALKKEGYRVVLVNSNPATIMTDPGLADATYIEPLIPEVVAEIIERERPDALLPTVGGQTALSLAVALAENGTLEKFSVELIGANLKSIKTAEDRHLFKAAMDEIGVKVPASGHANSLDEALRIAVQVTGFPAIIRPSFTLGGSGGGIAFNREEFEAIAGEGIRRSPIGEILVEESVLGWKEYELEVIRDGADNVIIVCSIENIDAMGVHTGDSITVAPQQTLTDVEYQAMRDEAIRVIRRVGVDTGGSNIQFAVNPEDGRRVVIEMNPRVSRSSALASKATGFPIAKIAALLAVGYRLDELPNDITGGLTPASFEPTIDYVVVKIPRWAFEKFPKSDPTLTIQMKSVGEVMAFGRNFREALQKGLRALEIDRHGLGGERREGAVDFSIIREKLRVPNWERIFYVRRALQAGLSVSEVARLTRIDPWFLAQIAMIVDREGNLRSFGLDSVPDELLLAAKRDGFSDLQLAGLWGVSETRVRARRWASGIRPVFKRVDTCAAEFPSTTPYIYSTYETEDESEPTSRRKAIVLGGGPNRIGQGIEFDSCCCQAVDGLSRTGYETIMVNCNPETVSTDYDISDRLYFEPLTLEDVLEIVANEKPDGVVVQFGGQTPLKLARSLSEAGVKILGTTPDSTDLAEDRQRFGALLKELGIRAPEHGVAGSPDEAEWLAERIGYPVLVRPSYVLGGRAMTVVYDGSGLGATIRRAMEVSPDHPVFIDRFLEDAFELDVDAISDGKRCWVAGVMQHIEEAGIHSGDSSCVLPPYKVSKELQEEIRETTRRLASALGVVGLLNIQFAIKDGLVYVLEVNPRASRTVPFVAKAIGIPLARLAAEVIGGRTLDELGLHDDPVPAGVFVKMPVFPFARFAGEDVLLGPEMKSTGEVMGADDTFGPAFLKAALGAGLKLPTEGTAFLSVHDDDKPSLIPIARALLELGFRLVATQGTCYALAQEDILATPVFKANEGRPSVVDRMIDGEIDIVVNTPLGRDSHYDEVAIRIEALRREIPCLTTLSAAAAAVEAIRHRKSHGSLRPRPISEFHRAKESAKA